MIIKPQHVTDLVGLSEKTITTVNAFIYDFQHGTPGHKNACLLHGHQGTGKTALIECTARDYNFPLLELNGSEMGTKDRLEQTLGRYITTRPRGLKHAIILIDEADGIKAIGTLTDLIRRTQNPIFLTANNDYPLRQINDLVIKVPFYRHKPSTINTILRRYTTDEEKIHDIIQNCDGDIRTALNMLDSLAQGCFTSTTIFKVVDNILSAKETKGVIDIDNSQLLEWLEENAQYHLLGISHLLAYQTLCNASRLMRKSSKYTKLMLTDSMRLVSGFHINDYVKPLSPTYKIKVNDNRRHVEILKSLSAKLPFHTHKHFESDVLPILKQLSKNEAWLKDMYYQYDFSEQELALLLNVQVEDMAVTSFMEMVKPGNAKSQSQKPVISTKLRQINIVSI